MLSIICCMLHNQVVTLSLRCLVRIILTQPCCINFSDGSFFSLLRVQVHAVYFFGLSNS